MGPGASRNETPRARGVWPETAHRVTAVSIERMGPRVLVVEDETSISEPLASHLAREGFEPEVAGTLAAAREAIGRDEPDVILLDVMLPDGDGRDFCRDVRAHSDVPIVMLTARGEEVDRIVGLELGADDYVVKPFSAGELVARMRASTPRPRADARRAPITIGSLVLDPASRSVTKDGAPIELAAKEFDLLRMLMSRAGEVVGREEIMDEVWDPHWFGPSKTLDVHISWLRKKIEDEAVGAPLHPHGPRRRVPIRRAPSVTRRCTWAHVDEGPDPARRLVRLRAARRDRGAHRPARHRAPRSRPFRARGTDAREPQTIAAVLARDQLEDDPAERRALVRNAARYAGDVGGRVVVLGDTGVAIADSAEEDLGEDFARRVARRWPAPSPRSRSRRSAGRGGGGDIAVAAAPIIDEGELVGVVQISRDVATVQANVGRATAAVVAVALEVGSPRGWCWSSRSRDRSRGRCPGWPRRRGVSGTEIGPGRIAGGGDGSTSSRDRSTRWRLVWNRRSEAQREFVATRPISCTPLTGIKLRLEAESRSPTTRTFGPSSGSRRQGGRPPLAGHRTATDDGEPGRGGGRFSRRPGRRRRAGSASMAGAGGAGSHWVSKRVDAADLAVAADPADVDQVLDVLIDNALTHAAGPIRVIASGGPGQALVSVSDRGPGDARRTRSRG